MPRLFSNEEMSEGIIIDATTTTVGRLDTFGTVPNNVEVVDSSNRNQINYSSSIIDELLEKKSTKRTKKCIICNSKNNIEEVVFHRYTNDICSKCKEKYIGVCRKCCGNYSKERLIDIFENGEYYCVNCLACSGYKLCHNCKKWKSNAISINNNFCYCKDCLQIFKF